MKRLLKFSLLAVAVACFLAGCGSSRTGWEPKMADRKKYYRAYVLAKAIQLGFGKDTIFNRDISLTVYNEITNYAMTTSHGDALDSLAQKLVDSIRPFEIEDYDRKLPIFMRSIEYYDSKELKRAIRKIARSKQVASR